MVIDRLGEEVLVSQGRFPALGSNHHGAYVGKPHLEGEKHQVGLQLDVGASWQNLVGRLLDVGPLEHFLQFCYADLDVESWS